MFCPKCGAQVPDGTKFCPACGTPLNPAAPAGGSAPAAGASGPVVTPVAPAAGDKAAAARLVRLVAAVVMIVAFFLPFVGTSIFGYEFSFSAFNAAFGIDFMGQHLDGNPAALLFVVPGVVALLGALLAKGKAGNILSIVCGAALLALLALNVSNANESLGGYITVNLLIGSWLFIIAGIASIVGGVLGLVKK
ncbi:zinc ribbon domain-containing protein [Thermophilibacter sp.]